MEKKQPNDMLIGTTLRIFWDVAAKYRREMMLSLLLPTGTVLISIGVPFFAGKVLAGLSQHDPNLNTNILLLAGCSLAGVVANRIGFTRNMVLQAKAMADLHAMLFERLLSRSVGFHTNRISGKLISDAIDFVSSFGALAAAGFINGFGFLAAVVIGLIVVWVNSVQLGLFLTVVVAITIVWAGSESRRRAALRNRRLVATKKLTAHLSDTIINTQTVKTFAQESREMEHNFELNITLKNLRSRDWQRAGRSGNNRTAALLAMQLGMLLLVVHLAQAQPAMLATGIFAFTYTMTLTNKLYEINTITRVVEEAFLNASPMAKMLQEPIELTDQPNASTLRVSHGRLEFKNVSFAYNDNASREIVFEQFSLLVKPGERVGLVGPSGGGKTTLTRLILRFDDVQQGIVLVDDQNIAEVTQESLRRNIAYVPQEPLLFHRSIRENIAYGRPDASDEAIIAAAKKAKAHDFIKSLPRGYDTAVGERGVKLSGGQRQRVAIARAILKDAPILILDEATSALDSENEVQVQAALWQLMRGRTAIVVAHRLSTIQRMDRIIVLTDGKIIEEGSHEQLLARKGLYARLWKRQSGGFIEE